MSEADALARRVADNMLAREGIRGWNIEIEDASESGVRLKMRVREDMLNAHNIAHGGMIFALADTAFAYACNGRNEMAVAHHASIAFLAQAAAGETLIADAREIARSGRSGVYHVEVRTAEGRVIAEFTGLSRTIGGPVIN